MFHWRQFHTGDWLCLDPVLNDHPKVPRVIKVKKILSPLFPVFIFLFLAVACNNFQVWEPDRAKQLRIFFSVSSDVNWWFFISIMQEKLLQNCEGFLGNISDKTCWKFWHEIKMFSKFYTVFSPLEIFIQKIIFSLGNLSNPKVVYVYRKLLIAMFCISKNSREHV